MKDDIDIRPALAADCDAILAMLAELARELGDGDRFQCRLDDIREHGFGTHSLFRCLIATRQQQNLGLALFFPLFSTTRGQPGVYLQDLWVSKTCRDAGLGLRMLQQVAVDAGQQWQARYLDLMVHGHNQAAERFYRRHGFDEQADDRHLSIEGDQFSRLQQPVKAAR
jgi:ribosomal protein S18 acetylase RimI-like enzyme